MPLNLLDLGCSPKVEFNSKHRRARLEKIKVEPLDIRREGRLDPACFTNARQLKIERDSFDILAPPQGKIAMLVVCAEKKGLQEIVEVDELAVDMSTVARHSISLFPVG